MTLVLDHSYSMNPVSGTTMGGKYLPAAVTNFVSNFSDTIDEVGVASFGSTVTNDVPIGQPFKAKVAAAVASMPWYGGTFSPGGLTNAWVMNNSAPTNAEIVAQVVVFFTDGKANMIQQRLGCGQTFNFGGYDTAGSGAAFFPTNSPDTEAGQETVTCSASEDGTMGGTGCNGCTASTYISPQTGNPEKFETAGITADSEYECIQLAQQMQEQGMTVYCIGLGGDPANPVNFTFLQEVANDPASPTYSDSLPTGAALIANDPSELDPLFEQIASLILLRLTQ
jgi:hypothetical protein